MLGQIRKRSWTLQCSQFQHNSDPSDCMDFIMQTTVALAIKTRPVSSSASSRHRHRALSDSEDIIWIIRVDLPSLPIFKLYESTVKTLSKTTA
ncbi:hypothetical protein FHG87_006330 [Trinorchestia longiramus]|nr:hypothetical protein FHG87_006330 [Trinorchestia longiramus]